MLYKQVKYKLNLGYLLKNNIMLIGIMLFLFCFLFMIYSVSTYNGIYYYGSRYTLADSYIWLLKPRAYGVLVMPFLFILFINMVKYDEYPLFAVRIGSNKKWILRRIKIAVFLSLTVAVIVIIICTFITSIQVKDIINWDKEKSIYFVVNNNTNEHIKIWVVVLVTIFTMFIRNLIICLATIFLNIQFKNKIFTFLIISSVVIFEMIYKNIPLFYNCIIVDYNLFINRERIIMYIVYCIVGFLISKMLIIRYSKKKEWINES